MDTDNKPELRTLRFRVKDKQSGKWLVAAARAVNFVWNYCNGRRFTRSITTPSGQEKVS